MKAIEFIVGRTESGQPLIHTIWIEDVKTKKRK
jgi:hypothetical protein